MLVSELFLAKRESYANQIEQLYVNQCTCSLRLFEANHVHDQANKYEEPDADIDYGFERRAFFSAFVIGLLE